MSCEVGYIDNIIDIDNMKWYLLDSLITWAEVVDTSKSLGISNSVALMKWQTSKETGYQLIFYFRDSFDTKKASMVEYWLRDVVKLPIVGVTYGYAGAETVAELATKIQGGRQKELCL